MMRRILQEEDVNAREITTAARPDRRIVGKTSHVTNETKIHQPGLTYESLLFLISPRARKVYEELTLIETMQLDVKTKSPVYYAR